MYVYTNGTAQMKILKKKSILITHYKPRARARMRCPSFNSNTLCLHRDG